MAAFAGKDVKKLKGKGGKWKYMSEQDMLDTAAKYSPYRYVRRYNQLRAFDAQHCLCYNTWHSCQGC